MALGLSPLGGAAWQFFDNSGNPLSTGLLYTYNAGTTTPAGTSTTASGATANANPIVLDAAGRVPVGIWLTVGVGYKFVLTSSTGVPIGSWDNIYTLGPAIASEAVAFNASIGVNNVLPLSMYNQASARSLAVATQYPYSDAYLTSGTRTAVMAAYPRIFAKDMLATRMGVKLPFANGVLATYKWRWLVYTNDPITGMPGPSVVDTGAFFVTKETPANNQDRYYWKSINYNFRANTIYWFAFAFDGVNAQYVANTFGGSSATSAIGGVYASGNTSQVGNATVLTVPTSFATDPASTLLNNNPPLVISDLSQDTQIAPVFFLQA
jgi:hypothetical protein